MTEENNHFFADLEKEFNNMKKVTLLVDKKSKESCSPIGGWNLVKCWNWTGLTWTGVDGETRGTKKGLCVAEMLRAGSASVIGEIRAWWVETNADFKSLLLSILVPILLTDMTGRRERGVKFPQRPTACWSSLDYLLLKPLCSIFKVFPMVF